MNEHTEPKTIEGTAERIDEPAVAERVAEPAAEVRADLRAAREMIPVGPRGATLMNFAQQIDFAQSMAKAMYSVPEFLRGNVGDCLAIVDIASRADLSPYMLAMKTYLEPKSKKLCFESQAYHALAMPWLKGDFEIAYEGDGDATVCVIGAYLKSDPTKLREHRSEKLADAVPARNENGTVKGSPLWDKKPRVQLAYDTMRDWVRLYCPRATLGIYTPDEIEQYVGAAEAARNITPPGVAARNRALPRGEEGHRGEEHINAELAQIAPGSPGLTVEKTDKGKKPAKPKTSDKTDVSRETTGGSADKPAATAEQGPKDDQGQASAAPQVAEAANSPEPAPAAPAQGGEAKEPAKVSEAATDAPQPTSDTTTSAKATADAAKPAAAAAPAVKTTADAETWQEYAGLWDAIIEKAAAVKIVDDWKRERSIRERLKMPAETVAKYRAKVDGKAAALAGASRV